MNNEIYLDRLPVGERATVLSLDGENGMVRRLSELGFTEGACVCCLMRSPFGDPSAYRVRGTVIALRARDASLVKISLGG